VITAIRECLLVPFDANAGQIWNLKPAGLEVERFLRSGIGRLLLPVGRARNVRHRHAVVDRLAASRFGLRLLLGRGRDVARPHRTSARRMKSATKVRKKFRAERQVRGHQADKIC
jgi:hypothetical protein